MTLPTVAFVGLGRMGEPMVANLRKGDLPVRVYDANPDLAQQVAARTGATACEDWAALARGADIVITMLPTGAVVREVLLQAQGGLARQLASGTVVVDMSSSEPMGTRELGVELAAMGLDLVDAPVSGGVPGAVAGTLSIMAGGNGAAIDRALPVFLTMSKRVFRTGGPGSGHATKALNNFVAASAYAATAEAVLIGQHFGLDEAQLVEIINASTGRSFNSEVVFAGHVVPRKFATGFAMALMAKDVAIARDLGHAVGADAPLSRLVSQRWDAAREALGGDVDQSRALLAWGVAP